MPASSKRITYLQEKKKDKPASAAKKKERSVKKFGEMPDAAKNRAALFGNSHLFTNGRNRESMAISFYEMVFLERKALPKTFLLKTAKNSVIGTNHHQGVLTSISLLKFSYNFGLRDRL